MIREFRAPPPDPEVPASAIKAKKGSKKGRGSVDRPERPWHVKRAPAAPKPFGLTTADMEYLKMNTRFDEKTIKYEMKRFCDGLTLMAHSAEIFEAISLSETAPQCSCYVPVFISYLVIISLAHRELTRRGE